MGQSSSHELQEQFQRPTKDLYTYFQIRNYITNHKEKWFTSKNPNSIEEYFIGIVEKVFQSKNHISHMYKGLLNETNENTGYI